MFSSPLPNPQLWNGPTIGYLQTYEGFANGGWWHDRNILAATGEGADIEEAERLGKNIFIAAAEAGIKQVVFSSEPHPERLTNRKVPLDYLDGKQCYR